ncbi:CHRD domain-containing protein [Saliphagus infecundisoli]|uniref:CHRD domain-containing protein n=1 Tax=Saliphagus infecundisoli TaxID=1849069 RepID=A0ABD5QG34_9EURY|nr:CHRD domain-containing protein [Saliphagus infecundisoli]
MELTRQTRRRVLQTAGVAIGSGIVMGTASADHEETWIFQAELTGEAETHDVETTASGHATFEIPPDDHRIHYSIDAEWLCHATQAHIHLGEVDEDGPVVVWLYPEEAQEPEPIEGRFDGTLAEGTFTADDLVGPLEGADADEIVTALIEENAYVNVHTEAYPAGEIRGQIRPDADTEDAITEARGGENQEGEEAGEGEGSGDEDGGIDDQDEVVTDAADADLSLGAINVADKGDDEFAGLFVMIENDGDAAIDFTGWTMRDRREDGVVGSPDGPSPFRFPDGFTLDAGEFVRIHTGGDESQDRDDTLHWGLRTQVWDETGDTVIVEDAEGDVALEESYDNGDRRATTRRFVSRRSSQFI